MNYFNIAQLTVFVHVYVLLYVIKIWTAESVMFYMIQTILYLSQTFYHTLSWQMESSFQFWRAHWLSDRVLDLGSRGRWFKPRREHCGMSLSKTLYPLLITGLKKSWLVCIASKQTKSFQFYLIKFWVAISWFSNKGITGWFFYIRPEFFYLLIYKPSYCNFPESKKK